MESKFEHLSLPELLTKLNSLYDKEEAIKKETIKLIKLSDQLQEDKELLQLVIMHQSNKKARK